MVERRAPLNVHAGDGTFVENRPSKWRQTWNILSPYVTEPINAMQRLWNDPAIVYGLPPTEQTIADSLMLSGMATGGSAFAPKPRNAMAMGIRAFHGSPHSFDKFSMGKIGTGEGAQAYGSGLYFAEEEAIARGYRDALTKNMPEGSGSLYEVDIAANPKEFIDWDAPLSTQPELNEKLHSIGWGAKSSTSTGRDRILRMEDELGPAKTRELLARAGVPGVKYLDAGSRRSSIRAKTELLDWQEQLSTAEKELADAVARGDKFLIGRKQAEVQRVKDGIARVSKEAEGTRNYVVFDDRLISIVRKYGIAGASALLGYDILANATEAQAEELRRLEQTGAKK